MLKEPEVNPVMHPDEGSTAIGFELFDYSPAPEWPREWLARVIQDRFDRTRVAVSRMIDRMLKSDPDAPKMLFIDTGFGDGGVGRTLVDNSSGRRMHKLEEIADIGDEGSAAVLTNKDG